MKLCRICHQEIIKKYCESKAYFNKKIFCSAKCMGVAFRKEKTPEQKERARIRQLRRGYCTKQYTHPIYDAWRNMKRRCNYKASSYYKNYGGRGIMVCEEWSNDFTPFLIWANNNGWRKGLSLDRIDNNKGYQPDNCRWITQSEQLLNRRKTITLTVNGITKPLKRWADEYGLGYKMVLNRYHSWGNIPDVVMKPIDKSKIHLTTDKENF